MANKIIPNLKKMIISYLPIFGDLVHFGHFKILKKAKESSDILICGLLSDMASKSMWGDSISTIKERKYTIKSIKYVDQILIQNSNSPERNLTYLKKNIQILK